MNTIAFSRLLARDLQVEDRASLPADAALDVVAAMNGGISQFFARAPARLKKTTISATLRAAETLSVVFDAQYSRTITTAAFSAEMRGCTVQFNTTPLLNEVVNETTVLDEYLSPTLSTQATVYHDVVPLEDVVERATSRRSIVRGNLRAEDPVSRRPAARAKALPMDVRRTVLLSHRSSRKQSELGAGGAFAGMAYANYRLRSPIRGGNIREKD